MKYKLIVLAVLFLFISHVTIHKSVSYDSLTSATKVDSSGSGGGSGRMKKQSAKVMDEQAKIKQALITAVITTTLTTINELPVTTDTDYDTLVIYEILENHDKAFRSFDIADKKHIRKQLKQLPVVEEAIYLILEEIESGEDSFGMLEKELRTLQRLYRAIEWVLFYY